MTLGSERLRDDLEEREGEDSGGGGRGLGSSLRVDNLEEIGEEVR